MHGAGWEEWANKGIYLDMELWVTVAVRGIVHFPFRQIFQVSLLQWLGIQTGKALVDVHFFSQFR